MQRQHTSHHLALTSLPKSPFVQSCHLAGSSRLDHRGGFLISIMSSLWHWCHLPQGNCQRGDMSSDSQTVPHSSLGVKYHLGPTATATLMGTALAWGTVGTDLRPLSPSYSADAPAQGNDGQPGSSLSHWDDHRWAGVSPSPTGILPMTSAEQRLCVVLFKGII